MSIILTMLACLGGGYISRIVHDKIKTKWSEDDGEAVAPVAPDVVYEITPDQAKILKRFTNQTNKELKSNIGSLHKENNHRVIYILSTDDETRARETRVLNDMIRNFATEGWKVTDLKVDSRWISSTGFKDGYDQYRGYITFEVSESVKKRLQDSKTEMENLLK